jgi:hypothetical protein
VGDDTLGTHVSAEETHVSPEILLAEPRRIEEQLASLGHGQGTTKKKRGNPRLSKPITPETQVIE